MITAEFIKPIFSAADNKNEPDNGYRVFLYKCLESSGEDKEIKKGKLFTAFGYYLGDISTAIYILNGTWVNTKSYGEQYKVENFEEKIANTERGIMSFLTSSAMKGVGEVTAKRIYEKFGNKTLSVMDDNIEELLKVRGITRKKLQVIEESYTELRGARDIITTLAPYDVSSHVAIRVYKRYKASALDIIKKHPYQLQENHGIGFLTCDKIARAFDFDMESPERIQAAIEFALIRIESDGHCGCRQESLLKTLKSSDILGFSFNNKKITEELKKMIDEKKLYYVKKLFFRAVTYLVECEAAESIINLLVSYKSTIPNIEQEIKDWEKKTGCILDVEHKKAITTALSSGVSVITGGAGRGKTTITKAIVDIRKKQKKNNRVCLLAPTGRAAKELRNATKTSASTIHSRLELRGFENIENIDDDIIIEDDTVIVDETSMLDIWLFRNLLVSIKKGRQLILIGDVNQLPSVGCGAVLRDVIESKTVPVIRLIKNYRQASEGALIVDNGDKINDGDTSLIFDKNSFMLYNMQPYSDQFEQSAKVMIALYKQTVAKYGKDEVIVLSPHHHADTKSSTDNMNKYIQYYINPHNLDSMELEFRSQIFRMGDIVVQTVNDDGIANGDVGVVSAVFKDKNELSVIFADKKVNYSGEKLMNLELAYALSVHKSQGGQYQCVILNLLLGHGIMLKRNLLYTAISRAKREVHLVSTIAAINKAIATEDTNIRLTLLKEKIQQLYKKSSQEEEFTEVDADHVPFAK